MEAYKRLESHKRFDGWFEYKGVRVAIVKPQVDPYEHVGPMPPGDSWGWVDPVMQTYSGGSMYSRDEAIRRATMHCEQMNELDRRIDARRKELEL